MAVQVEVKLVCDYCQGVSQEVQRAERTRAFALDGDRYEVEVCDKHSEQLDKALETWRRISRRGGTKPRELARARKLAVVKKAPATPRRAPVAYDKKEYIKWAKAQGYNVNPSARPSGPLVRKFLDAKAAGKAS